MSPKDEARAMNNFSEPSTPSLYPSHSLPPHEIISKTLKAASAAAATFLARGRTSLTEQQKYECALCWE